MENGEGSGERKGAVPFTTGTPWPGGPLSTGRDGVEELLPLVLVMTSISPNWTGRKIAFSLIPTSSIVAESLASSPSLSL